MFRALGNMLKIYKKDQQMHIALLIQLCYMVTTDMFWPLTWSGCDWVACF